MNHRDLLHTTSVEVLIHRAENTPIRGYILVYSLVLGKLPRKELSKCCLLKAPVVFSPLKRSENVPKTHFPAAVGGTS